MRITLITALAMLTLATAAQASFPGADGRIVFEHDAGAGTDLHTIAPDGSDRQRLTRRLGIEEEPVWSPDGTRIAFAHSGLSDGSPTELYTMAADGGDRRAVTDFGSVSTSPAWTLDGRLAFFGLRDSPKPTKRDPVPPAELYTIAADGSALVRLTHDRRIQVDPLPSPDGTRIAFGQFRPIRSAGPGVFDQGLFTMAADGTDRRTVIAPNPRKEPVTASWSPDGSRLAVEVVREIGHQRQSDLALVDPDGSGLRFLTATRALETNPAFSPDGTMIAFTSDRHRRHGPRERGGRYFEVYTMRVDGTHVRRLTRDHVADRRPDWQPLPG